MLGESQAIARKKITELPRPQMGLATFQMSFGRQLYCEADLTDDLGTTGLQGFCLLGHLKRQGFPLGHFRKAVSVLAGWVGAG